VTHQARTNRARIANVRAIGTPVAMAAADMTAAHGKHEAKDRDKDGGPLWGLMESLAGDRGEEFYLTASPGRVRWRLDWRSPLGARDLTDSVTLAEGLNCEVEPAYALNRPIEELVAMGNAWGAGKQAAAMRITARGGAVMGRRAALSAVLQTAAVQALSGGPSTVSRPDLPTRAAAELAARSRLRELMVPVVAAAVEVTDPALFAKVRPGDLVLCRWPFEMTGLYTRAVARIRTATYSVTAPWRCSLSVELWDVL